MSKTSTFDLDKLLAINSCTPIALDAYQKVAHICTNTQLWLWDFTVAINKGIDDFPFISILEIWNFTNFAFAGDKG